MWHPGNIADADVGFVQRFLTPDERDLCFGSLLVLGSNGQMTARVDRDVIKGALPSFFMRLVRPG